jgi:uncharacterized protein YkwD
MAAAIERDHCDKAEQSVSRLNSMGADEAEEPKLQRQFRSGPPAGLSTEQASQAVSSAGCETPESSKVELNDGVTSAEFASRLDLEVVRELNRVRADPKGYAAFLRELRALFRDNRIVEPGRIAIRTEEGPAAVDEAVAYLEQAAPLPSLRLSRGLSRTASDHVLSQGPAGGTGHAPDLSERLLRYGVYRRCAAENIGYGSEDARRIVIGFLVDDGVPGRGHRGNIMDACFRVVGVACGPHAVYDMMCVLDFAGVFVEK